MKNRLIVALLLVALTLLPLSCYQAGEESGNTKVVATIPPIASLVKGVGGDKVDVVVLVPPGESPHALQLTPGQLVEISKAKAYFIIGPEEDPVLEFERANLEKIKDQNPTLKVVNCSKGVEIVENDPHIWLSSPNAITMVENIAQGLILIDEANRDYYKANLATYREELWGLHRRIEELLSPYEGQPFLVYHNAFAYFARTYGLAQVALDEGGGISPGSIVRAKEAAREHNLDYIFVSPQVDTSQVESLAQEIDAEVVTIDPLPQDYLVDLWDIAQKLSEEFNN